VLTALLGLALHPTIATRLRSLFGVQVFHHHNDAPNVVLCAKKW
jgi:hypothetical protein